MIVGRTWQSREVHIMVTRKQKETGRSQGIISPLMARNDPQVNNILQLNPTFCIFHHLPIFYSIFESINVLNY
jgi:hypothetical protein